MACCLTGVGATLVCANTALKFSATEAYRITRISGFGRSVAVLDDSHLGLTKNGPMNYCPADLVSLRPMTVEVRQCPDNTDRFTAQTDAATSMYNPIPLGLASGTATNSYFTLTFPSTNTTAAKLNFSGFFIDDAGFDLSMRDRINGTFQIQPDGQTITWTAAAS